MNMWKKIARRLKALNEDHMLLDEMVAQLHACRTFPDVYQIIAKFAPRLLPGTSGALFLQYEATFDQVKIWGHFQPGKRKFTVDQCCALHRMKAHLAKNPKGLNCLHVNKSAGDYLCLPLMLDGQALGVLHLQCPAGAASSTHRSLLKPRMAEKMASHLAQKLGDLRMREMLSNQAVRDPLTSLFNRRYLEESLRREMALRSKHSVGIIMLDIDHFKRFNTRFTHTGGDALLRSFGNFLQKHVRGADVACRFGGEEFALILPGATLEVTRQRAEKVRKEVKKLKVTHQNKTLGQITLSLGVAASENRGAKAEEVLDAAVTALGQAKEEGRDRVIVA